MSIPSAIQSKNRADLSQFLIHLTKNGTYGNLEKVTTFKVHGYREVDIPVKAQDSLQKMVVKRKIEARGSFGYYRLKVNMYKYYHNTGYENVFANGYAEPSWLKAVCFSETPLSELKSFYDAVIEKRLAFEKKINTKSMDSLFIKKMCAWPAEILFFMLILAGMI